MNESMESNINDMSAANMRSMLKRMMGKSAAAKAMMGDNDPADMSEEELRRMLKKMAGADSTKGMMSQMMSEAVGSEQSSVTRKKRGKRLEETVANAIQLVESEEDEKPNGPWRIRATGITADIINGNGRRYPARVLEAAVKELKGHLHESAGQGRMLSLTGESDHPKDKGNSVPLLSETVFNWDRVEFDGEKVLLEGNLLGTSKGMDIHAQMRGGVIPGISQRGYGDSKKVKVNDVSVEEITQLIITGYDATAPNQQSDPNGSINYFESQSSSEDEMNLEELLKILKDHPELFEGVTEAQIKKMGEAQLKALEEKVREALGIDANANITESLKVTAEKARKFDEGQQQTAVNAAIEEACKELPFGDKLNKQFTEAMKNCGAKSADDVKAIAESKRREYSAIAAELKLGGMGFNGRTGLQVLGDVLERETGIPEFGRVSFEIMESLRKRENRAKRQLDLHAESPAAVFTERLLKLFDERYHKTVDHLGHPAGLFYESKLFEEAEATSDLNLPYSVSRAIIAEAFPNLVSANVFDVDIMTQTPMNIWFEAFAGETGYSVDVTDEVEAGGAEDTWYDLANKNIVPSTVVVTSNPAGTTYVEGADYVIDYELGKIKFLTAGDIGANDVLVDYTYHATRKGEDAEIERAKTTMSYQTIQAAADRLADYITHEAIVFSRSQLGWDAVGRTMINLIRQMQLDIDKRLIEKALMAALSVASNSGGTWTSATDPWHEFAEKLGYAKVKVVNRYYNPSSILMSMTNSDLLSNWDGFTREGFPNAVLNAAGFAGGVKGLPVFSTPVMRDKWPLVFDRSIVMHRVYQPMVVKGPFQTFGSNRKLVAAEQYYAEEYNASLAPVANKASYIVVA